jgi:putative tricarboxylic transport membrane protein
MDVLAGISSGFLIALTLKNIVYCFTGALIGTLIGVLPGIGPLATIAMLMPFTYHVDPVSSMIMLAGIFYGGSTTSILLNLPGEASSVITCLDGHQLAKQGKAAWRCRWRRSARWSPERSARWRSSCWLPYSLISPKSSGPPNFAR